GDLGCYGSALNQTPVIDNLATEGMQFTSYYSAASVCSPSRASLLTGVYPGRIGLGNGVLFPGQAEGLNPEEINLAKLLQSQGYATKLVGKWHLGDQEPFLPTNQGYDSFLGLPYSNDMMPDHPLNDMFNFPPMPMMRDDEVIDVDPNQASLTAVLIEEARRFIQSNADRPFYLQIAHLYVHVPIYAPHNYLANSQNGPYGAAVAHVDQTTGIILDTLDELGIAQDTIVMFVSDNGSTGDNGASNAPLNGGKYGAYEGGFRVPCIIRWPGKVAAGSTCDRICSHMDLLPTMAALLGIDLPVEHNTDGKDIRPYLFQEPGVGELYDAYYYYHKDRFMALRSGRWKFHMPLNELYDLTVDIAETNNLYAARPDVVASLNVLADACRQDLGDALKGIEGNGRRPAGCVEDPVLLVQTDWESPYLEDETVA
ncbi:MAG: sulfatase-like hydrolase/transferase, partial [Caldilineales bacterium]|nr:sulfatase-like hydrolase/transferase [Caldilineales bacterium]